MEASYSPQWLEEIECSLAEDDSAICWDDPDRHEEERLDLPPSVPSPPPIRAKAHDSMPPSGRTRRLASAGVLEATFAVENRSASVNGAPPPASLAAEKPEQKASAVKPKKSAKAPKTPKKNAKRKPPTVSTQLTIKRPPHESSVVFQPPVLMPPPSFEEAGPSGWNPTAPTPFQPSSFAAFNWTHPPLSSTSTPASSRPPSLRRALDARKEAYDKFENADRAPRVSSEQPHNPPAVFKVPTLLRNSRPKGKKRAEATMRILEMLHNATKSESIPIQQAARPATRRYAACGIGGNELQARRFSDQTFCERMERRKLQNPLACGLLPKKHEVNSSDYFYREIIVRKPTAEGKAEPPVDEDVDVLGDGDTLRAPTIAKLVAAMPDEEADEVLVRNPADECVADIRKLLPLREQSAASEEEDGEAAAPSPMDRLQQAVEQFECPLLKEHLRVLLPAVVGQRGADLTTLGVVGGCSVFYARSLANATRLRQRLMLFSHKRLQAIEEAHAFLLHRLPNEFLASYLNLLRFLKISGSNLAVHLVENAKEAAVRKANDCVRDFINTKVTDPNLRFGRANSDIAPLPNVSLVLIYPQVAMEGQTVNKHAHKNMNLLPAAVKCVEKVELRFDLVTDIRTLVHLCLDLVRRRVKELVKRRPDDHVFLAGWGISTLINMQALQKVAGVAGVLNFAYPMRSPLGFRGTVDDSTCITYCPSLFVVGDAGMNVNLQELQTMRKNMICDSGVIVVGGADDHLYVSPLFLSVERVSQHCVDRMILDHVVDFMKLVISEGGMSARAKRQHLVAVQKTNPFDVPLEVLKNRWIAGNAPGPLVPRPRLVEMRSYRRDRKGFVKPVVRLQKEPFELPDWTRSPSPPPDVPVPSGRLPSREQPINSEDARHIFESLVQRNREYARDPRFYAVHPDRPPHKPFAHAVFSSDFCRKSLQLVEEEVEGKEEEMKAEAEVAAASLNPSKRFVEVD